MSSPSNKVVTGFVPMKVGTNLCDIVIRPIDQSQFSGRTSDDE